MFSRRAAPGPDTHGHLRRAVNKSIAVRRLCVYFLFIVVRRRGPFVLLITLVYIIRFTIYARPSVVFFFCAHGSSVRIVSTWCRVEHNILYYCYQ